MYVREWVSISISESIGIALESDQMLQYDFLRLKLFLLSTFIYVYIIVYVLWDLVYCQTLKGVIGSSTTYP